MLGEASINIEDIIKAHEGRIDKVACDLTLMRSAGSKEQLDASSGSRKVGRLEIVLEGPPNGLSTIANGQLILLKIKPRFLAQCTFYMKFQGLPY